MVLPDEVVLYDLEHTDDPATLVAMVADPQARWFARARLAGLAVKGMVAATWNPHLHPRGRDGQFINTWGWVRFLLKGKWERGQVTSIDPTNGVIAVRRDDGKVEGFNPAQAESWLYSIPPPKARMHLPDPKEGTKAPFFMQVGGQGGSNPGAMFQATESFGDETQLTVDQLADVLTKHSVTTGPLGGGLPEHGFSDMPAEVSTGDRVILYDDTTGTIGLATAGQASYENARGEHITEPMANSASIIYGNSDTEIEQVWGELIAQASLINNGQKLYIKKAKSKNHAANELLANRLYEMAGVNVAETIPGEEGTDLLASRLIPVTTEKVDLAAKLDDPEVIKAMQRDFAVDAWLANWDVAGLNLENTQVVDGVPFRIDAGGAILYRAQGGAKGQNFGPVVGELETMRDKHMNPQAAKVFGGTGMIEIKDGAKRIAAISPTTIKAMVEDVELPDSVADTLIARRAYILDKYAVDDPYATDPVPEPAPEPEVPEHEKPMPDISGLIVLPDDELPPEPEPEPEPDAIVPMSAPSYTWDGISKQWVKVESKPEASNLIAHTLSTYYDHKLFQKEFDPSWVEGETLYVLHNGSLHQVLQAVGGGKYQMQQRLTGEIVTDFLVQPKVMRRTEDNDQQVVALLGVIDAYEKLMRERSITEIATEDTYAEIFNSVESQPGLEPEPDTVYPPQFKAQSMAMSAVHDGQPLFYPSFHNDYAYLWAPDSERLYRPVSVDADDSALGGPLMVEDLSDGSVHVYTNLDPEIYVVPRADTYSVELLDAKVIKDQINNGVNINVVGDPNPNVVAWLDQQKKINDTTAGVEQPVEDIEKPQPEPTPLKLKPDPQTHLTWAEMKAAINYAIQQHGSTVGVWSAFWQLYGSESQQIDSLYETFENWVIEDSGYPDLLPYVDQFLMDPNGKPFVDEPGDLEPPTKPPVTDNPHKDSLVPFVHDSLAPVGDDIVFGTMTLTEAKEDIAKSLVGKVVSINSDAIIQKALGEDGTMNMGNASTASPGVGLFYIESYDLDTTKLKMRLVDGQKKDLALNSLLKLQEVSLVPDDLKTSPVPTLKKNGDIVRGGQVVGTWKQNYAHYWNDPEYEYTIYGDASVTGHTITGKAYQKNILRTMAHYAVLPKPVPVKAKKGSPAVAKIVDDAQQYPGGIKGKYKYADGTEAHHGDWVKSTKGGGGFVGKIVGWPDQENHPGLAFAVSAKGEQKAVNLKTMKKVPASFGQPEGFEPPFGDVPNVAISQGIKFADGKTPKVGQKVTAGKPGSTQVTGIVHHLNEKQGFVYILTDDGKTLSKTFNVTKVLEEPDLIWSLDDAAIAPALVTTKSKKSDPVPGYTYPGPDGAILDHNTAEEAEWLDDHPKRKLTKDGYVPKVGLRARNKAGDELVITRVAESWDANPNRVQVWNLSKQKTASASTTTIEIDHAAELTDFKGDALSKVSTLILPGNTVQGAPEDGSVMYRVQIHGQYYSPTQSKYRQYEEWQYFIVSPGGSVSHIASSNGNPPVASLQSVWGGFTNYVKSRKPNALEKIAVFDSTAGPDAQVTVQPMVVPNYYNKSNFIPSNVTLDGISASTPEPTPEPEPEIEPPKPLPSDPPIEDLLPPETPEPVSPTPTPEPAVAEPEGENTPAPPKTVPAGNISIWTPPPNPAPKTSQKPADPVIPEVTNQTSTLDNIPQVIVGTEARSVAAAAIEMIGKKDEKGPGTGLTYAAGDSDFIEDMAVRFTIDKEYGGDQEHLVARFRLRESVAEDTVGRLVTATDGKTGAWKLKTTAFPTELQEGDLIGVYVSSMEGNPLKPGGPQHEMDEPTARVVGPAVLVGKSAKSDLPLYRVPVMMQDGSLGEVDMEKREGASLSVFEYDYDAPAKASGNNLHLTETAQAAGWQKVGKMDMRGSMNQTITDETGKANWTGTSVGGMAKGTGGHLFTRTMPDGTKIRFNGAHSTEGGIGFDTTRRAVIAGEVTIQIPLKGQDTEDVTDALSKAMQAVGVPVDKQEPPSDEQLVSFALQKLVTNYHPTYTYRDTPITGPDDPRVTKTLETMSKELQSALGRNVTLDDVRIHTTDAGRMMVVLSPEVAKAIGKRQGNHHFHHHNTSGSGAVQFAVNVFGQPINGLMSTDERWSAGVMTTGMSSHSDMTIGSGDRVYTRATPNASFEAGNYIFSPTMMATSLEVYTKGVYDAFGRRGGSNLFLTNGGNIEYMFKRKYEPEQITFYIANSESERDQILAELKKRGVEKVGTRNVEDIIVTKAQAQKVKDFDKIGEAEFANDVPITKLISSQTALLERTTADVG